VGKYFVILQYTKLKEERIIKTLAIYFVTMMLLAASIYGQNSLCRDGNLMKRSAILRPGFEERLRQRCSKKAHFQNNQYLYWRFNPIKPFDELQEQKLETPEFYFSELSLKNGKEIFIPTYLSRLVADHNLSRDVDTAWVKHYASVLESSRDIVTAITTDASGNVYVTGYSEVSGRGSDYATIKYDAVGVEQWIVLYNGPGYSEDWSWAIAVDNSENVYVTGFSEDSGTGFDYATIKYDAAGNEQWVARYTSSGNFDDFALAISVDGSGNVYVTGYSGKPYTGDDYTTIKYDAAGVEQWISHYSGPGYSEDWAEAIAVDDSGNVYVTGGSSGSGTRFDYATIKYNAVGAEQWIARYNGPKNSIDRACAIALDDPGNVYVTGYSEGIGYRN